MILAALAVEAGCGGAAPLPMAARSEAAPTTPASDAPAGAPAAAASPAVQPAYPQAGYPSPPSPPPAPGSPPTSPGLVASPAPNAAASAKAFPKNAGPSVRAAVIIYKGSMTMAVEEDAYPKTIDRIIDLAEGLGGHLTGRKDDSVEIKVPSGSFREAMSQIDGIGTVTSRSVTADDVSEEFHDLEVRLANLRATRARLQEFLAKSGGVNDMLTVERELERVSMEIDRAEGRLEFLRARAVMSVIDVSLTPKAKALKPIAKTTNPTLPDAPVPWVGEVGIDGLLSLHK